MNYYCNNHAHVVVCVCFFSSLFRCRFKRSASRATLATRIHIRRDGNQRATAWGTQQVCRLRSLESKTICFHFIFYEACLYLRWRRAWILFCMFGDKETATEKLTICHQRHFWLALSDATFVQKLFSLLYFFNLSAHILKSKHVYVKNGIIKRTDTGRKKKINVKPHHAAWL